MVFVTQLVYLHPGKEDDFHAFEDTVIPLMAKHGGELTVRVRPGPEGVIAAAGEAPYEIHVVRFESEDHLRRFERDPDRQQVIGLRDQSVRKSIVITGRMAG